MFPQDPVRFILSVKVACQKHFILGRQRWHHRWSGIEVTAISLKRRKGQSRNGRVDRWKSGEWRIESRQTKV